MGAGTPKGREVTNGRTKATTGWYKQTLESQQFLQMWVDERLQLNDRQKENKNTQSAFSGYMKTHHKGLTEEQRNTQYQHQLVWPIQIFLSET